jgi:hypothetical protein
MFNIFDLLGIVFVKLEINKLRIFKSSLPFL